MSAARGGVGTSAELSAGGAGVPDTAPFIWTHTPEPALSVSGYYFASQTPYFNYLPNFYFAASAYPPPPLPGASTFSPTNASPLLIAAFGQPFTVSGWAKMSIGNGYPGKFAFLEQYFDYAFNMTSSNRTGVLSPYGEFFPTEPGPMGLVTMPDLDQTNSRGTGIVNVIKLQLDVNHDGTMDLSFTGPDNTSQSRPFMFWLNNDCDAGSPFSSGPGAEIVPPASPDYSDYVSSQRDFEDYARLWVCGVPSLTNADSHVTLGWGTIVHGQPAIGLARNVETNGGTLYLNNTNVAAALLQRGPHPMLPNANLTVSQANQVELPANLFTNAGNKYLLFDGAGIGSGELVLTVLQGTNILARTSAWLDIHDVRDFYERMVISNNFSGAISNWTAGKATNQIASSSALGEDKELIVFVHGINVSQDDWMADSETVYKRLYWAGFHGKFATVKWSCEFFNLWTYLSLDTMVFNRSEIKAYKSGSTFKAYTDDLHSRFPGYRLHLLVHSQGNAVVSEAIEQGASFDTYILTQGAMPCSAYDANAPTYAGLVGAESTYGPTPEWAAMGYRGVYTNMPGHLVNFYNTNDPVLSVWVSGQGGAKPNITGVTDYRYNGTTGSYEPAFGASYTVTDPQESRAYVSRSRTLSVGQSPPESAHGVLQSGIDLTAHYGFRTAFPGDHSAQWVWPIQTTRPYYQQVLTSCGIIPAP